MSASGLIGAIFVVLSVLVIVGEWVRRDLKSRLQSQPTPNPRTQSNTR